MNWQITREKIILGQSIIILLMIIMLAVFVVANNRTVMKCGTPQIVSYPCQTIDYPQCPDCLCNINSLHINQTKIVVNNTNSTED